LASVLEAGDKAPWWREREGRAGAHARRHHRAIRVPRETPLVGRDGDLDTLADAFAEARSGRGRTVLVDGEAGVGKTRLLDELVRRLRDAGEDPHVLYGSNPPGGVGRSRGALAEAVVAHFGEAGLEARIAPYLTVTPRLVPAFAAYLTGAPAREGDALAPEALHALYCHLARALAAERPVVWIVEDLHFGSVEARALLLSLARMAHDQRLLLVATTRPGLQADEIGYLDRLETTRRIGLGRLSPRQVIDLLREALGSERLAEQLGGRIAAKSDGNPYFIFEMLREMKERSSLRKLPDGSYTASDGVDRLTVPSTVRDLLLGHLKDLPAEHRALLDVGAVMGFAFDPDLVARVREMKRLHVLEALAGIERRHGVVRATGSGFQFDHHQLQEVLYAALPPLLRVEYHAMLGEAFEARGRLGAQPPAGVAGDAAVFLAEHYLRGQRREQGLPYVLPALDHLAALYRNEALLEMADLALETLGPGDPALRCDVQLRQAECLDLLGQREAQKAAADGALAAAEAAGDPGRAVRARLAIGWVSYGTANYESARAAFADVVERALSCGDVALEAAASGALANVLRLLGRPAEASPHRNHPLTLLRTAGDRAGEAAALLNLGIDHLPIGRFEEARAFLEQSLQLARELGLRRIEANAVGSLGHVYATLGRYDLVVESCRAFLTLARGIGYRPSEAVAVGNLGQALIEGGDLEGARRCLEECRAVVRTLQQRHVDSYSQMYEGDIARAAGDRVGARRAYEEALATARSLNVPNAIAETAFALGRLLQEDGAVSEARELLAEADALTRAMSLALPGSLPGVYLALMGERDAAQLSVSEAMPMAKRGEAHLILYRATRSPSHLREARVLLERVCEHLQGAERDRFWRIHPAAVMLQQEEKSLGRIPGIDRPSGSP
jgi:tetratricopeptide (TPR) repeat protein